jgi:alcohol dehydrogenase class IV
LFKVYLPRLIVFGEGALDDLAEEVAKLGVKRILVITDNIVYGLTHSRLDSALVKFSLLYIDDVPEEPTFDYVESKVSHVKRFSPEIFLAVGGGSVIDAAKALYFRFESPNVDLATTNPLTYYGLGSKSKLICVPTTSGTGSDASFGVVLTRHHENRRVKVAMGSYELVPWGTYLEPGLTISMPPKVTRNTGLDALVHSFEAYVSTGASDFTDALAEKAVELVLQNLPLAYSDGSNAEARSKMQLAATMAGAAFSASGLGLVHGLGHAIGAEYGFPHGISVALYLPHVIRYNSTDEIVKRKYADLARRNGYNSSLRMLIELYAKVDGPVNLVGLGVKPESVRSALPRLVEMVMSDNEIVFNPVLPLPDKVEEIIKDSINGLALKAPKQASTNGIL